MRVNRGNRREAKGIYFVDRFIRNVTVIILLIIYIYTFFTLSYREDDYRFSFLLHFHSRAQTPTRFVRGNHFEIGLARISIILERVIPLASNGIKKTISLEVEG